MASGMTDDELQHIVDDYRKARGNSVPKKKQQLDTRVFVNRSVSMDKIQYIGFDMDHTLVEYKTPEYEKLAYDLIVDRLVEIGYPQDIKKVQYDPTFPLRGLFFDKTYGNLLKTDQFGNILSCFHGFKSLSSVEIRFLYPNKYVQPLDSRIYILYTLYNLPEVFILTSLVNYFDNHPEYSRLEGDESQRNQGVQCGNVAILYKMIWQDVRGAVDFIHQTGRYAKKTMENLEKYLHRDPLLPQFLDKFRKNGRVTFIVTNSDYEYTKTIMKYLLEPEQELESPTGEERRTWKSYFNYVIVDAKKPLFFEEGSMLREVDEESSSLKLGVFTGSLHQGKVYSGGSSDAFCRYSGAKGKQILYVGDHIFGDVIKAKKEQAWRTFLVIRELSDEVSIWESNQCLFTRLKNLEYILAEMYTSEDLGGLCPTGVVPSTDSLRRSIKVTAQEMEDSYPSQLGSLLRCGSRMTHFAAQSSRFADLYSSAGVNLLHYPDCHLFTAPHQLMPHESYIELTSEARDVPSNLSPLLNAKLFAKHTAQEKIHKGHLARGMSTIDHDVDEDDTAVSLPS